MNDYDDSEDYSSAGSFRARSNTWPLNRPDLAAPNSVCIDETLPEIELEEDDLFTTNENWSTGLVDHDIMSWDPVLNAQSHHHHHLHQPQPQPQPQPQTQQQQQQHHQPQTNPTIHHQHQQRQQPQLQLHQQRQQQPIHQTLYHHQHQQPHDSLLSGSTIILSGSSTIHRQDQQQPPQSQQQQQHQTLNSTHCLADSDDLTNEYHLQQLHHLHLDNVATTPASNNNSSNNNQSQPEHQAHYIAPLSSSAICIQQQQSSTGPSSASGLSGSNESYHNISPSNHQHHPHLHHNHHHLQPLTSACYDLDQIHSDLDLKTTVLDNDHHNQHHHHQLHYLTSSSLDQHPTNSHGLLSSSLGASGFGLSGDLEDLDYKAVDPSTILQSPPFDDQIKQQQAHLQGQTGGSDLSGCAITNNNGGTSGNNKQSNSSITSSKTKLNTPRRNAWGSQSYADLISQAINSTNDKRLTLSQIYDWMVQHVPYFKDKGDSNSSAGWKNSVRHNLSLHTRFKRLQNEGTGKSSWWTINPEANIGKCARRRAASMEASKYEKKRGRAKKRAEAVRQGLVSYPSLTNSSLNGSSSALEQQPQIQSAQNQFEQPTDGSDNVNNIQPSTGLYVASSQQSLYDEEDKLPQPTTTPPLQINSAPPPQQQQPDTDCLFYCYTSHNHYIRPQANVRTDLTAD